MTISSNLTNTFIQHTRILLIQLISNFNSNSVGKSCPPHIYNSMIYLSFWVYYELSRLDFLFVSSTKRSYTNKSYFVPFTYILIVFYFSSQCRTVYSCILTTTLLLLHFQFSIKFYFILVLKFFFDIRECPANLHAPRLISRDNPA